MRISFSSPFFDQSVFSFLNLTCLVVLPSQRHMSIVPILFESSDAGARVINSQSAAWRKREADGS